MPVHKFRSEHRAMARQKFISAEIMAEDLQNANALWSIQKEMDEDGENYVWGTAAYMAPKEFNRAIKNGFKKFEMNWSEDECSQALRNRAMRSMREKAALQGLSNVRNGGCGADDDEEDDEDAGLSGAEEDNEDNLVSVAEVEEANEDTLASITEVEEEDNEDNIVSGADDEEEDDDGRVIMGGMEIVAQGMGGDGAQQTPGYKTNVSSMFGSLFGSQFDPESAEKTTIVKAKPTTTTVSKSEMEAKKKKLLSTLKHKKMKTRAYDKVKREHEHQLDRIRQVGIECRKAVDKHCKEVRDKETQREQYYAQAAKAKLALTPGHLDALFSEIGTSEELEHLCIDMDESYVVDMDDQYVDEEGEFTMTRNNLSLMPSPSDDDVEDGKMEALGEFGNAVMEESPPRKSDDGQVSMKIGGGSKSRPKSNVGGKGTPKSILKASVSAPIGKSTAKKAVKKKGRGVTSSGMKKGGGTGNRKPAPTAREPSSPAASASLTSTLSRPRRNARKPQQYKPE